MNYLLILYLIETGSIKPELMRQNFANEIACIQRAKDVNTQIGRSLFPPPIRAECRPDVKVGIGDLG